MPSKKEKQPLSVTHPELAKEADGWNPDLLTAGSSKKCKWICGNSHNFEATVQKRALRGYGCPICSNRKISIGVNDLASTHPSVAQEAFGWDPTEIVAGSPQKRMWKCHIGHTWSALVVSRTRGSGTGCPVCSNRIIAAGFNDLEKDFPEIAIEAYGWNPKSIGGGSHRKMQWQCKEGHIWSAQVVSRVKGNGCPFCSGRNVIPGVTDLSTTHPEIAIRAKGWDPKKFSMGSHTKVNWVCELGHNYLQSIAHQASGQACPFCAGKKILVGFNDLATTHPKIALELIDDDASKITAGSHKRITRRCELGHLWKSSVKTLVNGHGCPYCSGTKLLAGFNDLLTKSPEIAVQAFNWDPSTEIYGSMHKRSWQCPEGHVWKTTVQTRVRGSGCPTCANSGFDPNAEGFLYFLQHLEWQMYQVGITNFPKDRLQKHLGRGWDLIEIRGPMDGHLSKQWETAILRMLKAKGADLSNSKIAGKFDGYSEAWSKSTFEAESIKELMRLTEEFEEGR